MLTKTILLLLIVPTAIMYRAGGMAKHFNTEPRWIPMWARQKWIRQWIIPTLWSLAYIPLIHAWYQVILLLCFLGASGALLGTYWDWLFNFDNYWFSGFCIGLTSLFLLAFGISWYMILARAIFLAVFWGAWCALFSKDYVEEFGRGGWATISLLLT